MLHDKSNGTATFTTRETLASVTRWRYNERWRVVVMEGTQSFQIGSGTLQRDEVRDDVHDVRGVQNLVNGNTVYHEDLLLGKL
jgi:hypothetical protein